MQTWSGLIGPAQALTWTFGSNGLDPLILRFSGDIGFDSFEKGGHKTGSLESSSALKSVM